MYYRSPFRELGGINSTNIKLGTQLNCSNYYYYDRFSFHTIKIKYFFQLKKIIENR